MPVEFQGAAYRFGHSLVRPSYRANMLGDVNAQGNPAPFFGMIFDPAGEGQADPVDLRGGARARRRFIGWQTFFDFGAEPRPGGAPGTLGEDVRPNKLIDTRISTPLFNLPLGAIASGDPPTALPQRNLLGHLTWSLPSGQSIARAMGAPVLGGSDFPELRDFHLGLEDSTPLWYYVLREAHVMSGGRRLGPMGGRIVGEVFLGLLELDRDSYLAALPTHEKRLKTDDRRTDPREATQIPARSSPAGRSPAPRRPPAGHTDPPGATRPSSADAGSSAPATPPSSAPVPNPRGECQRM